MIPKVIHYCWFGRGELPELAVKCIASWKKVLPDYQIKEWNESNFDLNLYLYAKQAYDNKKYAFVTDVVRLYALQTEGGIYMDTDVEMLQPLDAFLNHTAFSGFESDSSLPTGIMASIRSGRWVSELLNYYNDLCFVDNSGKLHLETNVIAISKLMVEAGFKLNNTLQQKENYVTFYPSEYFCPKNPANGKINYTENTICIHHFAGSWVQPETFLLKFKKIVAKLLINVLGKKSFDLVKNGVKS